MNQAILMGRLTRDPEIRYTTNNIEVANYTLAVDRPRKRGAQQEEQTADFIRCVAFDKAAEFAEKYFRQGMRVLISGRIQTGSFTNREGQKIFTTDVRVNTQEFADSKGQASAAEPAVKRDPVADAEKQKQEGFMNIPDSVDDSDLPFN